MPRRFAYTRSVPQFGFPSTKHVNMRYVSLFNITLPNAHPTQTVWSANSIHNPLVDPATGGHRPAGYDQWKPFYQQYLVVGSKCTATVAGNTTVGDPALFTIELVREIPDVTLPANTMGRKLELSPQIAWAQLPSAPAYNGPYTLTNTFSARKWFTRHDVLDGWDDLGANYDDDPIEQAYFVVTIGDNAGAAQAGTWELTVELNYSVILAEPNVLVGSDIDAEAALDFDFQDMYPDNPELWATGDPITDAKKK